MCCKRCILKRAKKSMSYKISKKLTENGENDEKPNLRKGVHFWPVRGSMKIFQVQKKLFSQKNFLRICVEKKGQKNHFWGEIFFWGVHFWPVGGSLKIFQVQKNSHKFYFTYISRYFLTWKFTNPSRPPPPRIMNSKLWLQILQFLIAEVFSQNISVYIFYKLPFRLTQQSKWKVNHWFITP